MTSEESQEKYLSAEIIEPAHSTATLDALHLRVAIQAAPARFRFGFCKILDAITQGQTLEDAVHQTQPTLNKEAQSLVGAALKLPEPTRFILDATTTTEHHAPIQWKIRLLLIYPLVMIGISAALCAAVSHSLSIIASDSISEFGLIGFDAMASLVEDQLSANIAIFALVLWCLVIAGTIRLFGPRWSFLAVIGGVPLIGRPLRWISLSELLSRYSCAFRQVNETRTATEILAASFRNSEYEMVTQLVHQRILGGTPLGLAISQSNLSDCLCSPVILTLDRSQDISSACEKVSESLKKMAEARYRLIAAIMPLLVLATIATIVWGTLTGYISILMMMFRMFSSLA